MGRFRSAAKQSAFVMKQLQGGIIKSVGTVRNYEQSPRYRENHASKGAAVELHLKVAQDLH